MGRTAGPERATVHDPLDTERTAPSSVLRSDVRDGLRTTLGLSHREFSIALYGMDGLTVAGTARSLACSPHTVNSHLRRIYRKLGVANRVGVVARLLVAYAELERR